MAFIPAPNCVEVVFRFTWAGQRVAITLSFEGAAPATVSDMNSLATALETWWKASYRPLTPASLTLNEIAVTALDSATAPGIVLPITTNNTGTNANPSGASNSTVTTTFITALRGRSFRGRNYMVGLNPGYIQTATTISTALAGALVTAYINMQTAAFAQGFTHVVISRYHNNLPRVTAVSTPVTGYQQELFLDSQRRRLAGRGL